MSFWPIEERKDLLLFKRSWGEHCWDVAVKNQTKVWNLSDFETVKNLLLKKGWGLRCFIQLTNENNNIIIPSYLNNKRIFLKLQRFSKRYKNCVLYVAGYNKKNLGINNV